MGLYVGSEKMIILEYMQTLKRFSVLFLCFFAACTTGSEKNTGKQQQESHATTPSYKQAIVYTTAKNTTDSLTLTDTLHFTEMGQPLETQVCVFVDPTHTFQKILGIGGAITDAAAVTFDQLSKKEQQKLLEAYYDDQKGIGYTLARTSINSCDFSVESYSYVEDNDTSLKSFDISHDLKHRIPLIKAAKKKAGKTFTLYASPWSPPAWMKDNNDMLHGGHLKPAFYQNWADYFVKFIQAYKKEGLDIWGVTVQNEPMAVQTWESCVYTAKMERDFVKNNLGPTFKKKGLGDKKIVVWDHNRDLIYQRAETIFNDPEAAKYIWGLGYHWYETWTGSHMLFNNVKKVHEAFPDKKLMLTEASIENFDMNKIHEWWLGERYAHSMVHDFNSGAVAWTDWNILLNQKGGPNHVGNYCYAPVIADTETGKLIFTNAYDYIGHFSKFIRPGDRRVETSSNRDKLEATAFKNKAGKLSVIVLNRSDDGIPYHLWIEGKAAKVTSLPHSIQTLVVE